MTTLINYITKHIKRFVLRRQTLPILIVVITLVTLAAFPFPMRILEGPFSILLMLGVLAMIFRGVFGSSSSKNG